MYTLLKNIKELFDLFGCVTLYQKAYIDALHKAHDAADAVGADKSNARAVVAYNRAERSRVEYERANGEYEFARDVMHTALGI
jgi:hypothetical protein